MKGYCTNNRVMNTGVLAYTMNTKRSEIRGLWNEVCNACIQLKQPECQIFWRLLSQPCSDIIQAVDSSEIKNRSGL